MTKAENYQMPNRKRVGMLLDVTNVNNITGKETILSVLEHAKKPMTTKQISRHEHVKNRWEWNSIRPWMRQLLKKGQVKQLFKRGPYYVTKTTHGVVNDPKFHNVELQVLGKVSKTPTFDRKFYDARVYITFGVRNGKVDGRIAKVAGLSLDEWCWCRDVFLYKASEALGREVESDEVKVISIEIAHDLKARLDGITNCYTLTALDGTLMRIYQKKDDVVRSEVKFQNTSIRRIEDLIRGGVTGNNFVQASFAQTQASRAMNKKVDVLVEILKRQSARGDATMVNILRVLQEQTRVSNRLADGVFELLSEMKGGNRTS